MVSFNDEGQLSRVFVQLADTLNSAYDIVDTMDLLVETSTRHTRAVAAGVLLLDADGHPHVIASSTERSMDLEEAQLGAGQGPCLDSMRSGEPLEVQDIAARAAEWPDFAAVAAAEGLRASFAMPLRLRETTIGGLNLFFTDRGATIEHDVLLASTIAQIATIGVLQHQQLAVQTAKTDQLQGALDSRIVIEQAKGVIAQRRAIQVNEAFQVLRSHARDNGLRLRDTAQQIVSRDLVL
jgi:hypothetical protein